ncbi:MAG: radical SAM protein [Clostridia bacterium]|nr:radical SAM protein [Clostridia bacterium]
MIEATKSICPVCMRVIDAFYMEDDAKVFLEKNCPEHGLFRTLASPSVDQFIKWQNPCLNVPPKKTITNYDKGCPFDCGPCTEHLQTACCVLLEITERCNQKCPYCFASSGYKPAPDVPISEIAKWLDHLRELDKERPFNIQLSGGEPTVRDDLPQIIALVKQKGFEYVQLNTNGRRLAMETGYAKKLADAGLSAVFLQFDGMNDEIYLKLRGEKLLNIKQTAIKNCAFARLPVALVPTVVKGVNLDNIGEMVDYLLDNLHVLKGIHFQPVSFFGRYPEEDINEKRVTMFDIINEINKQTAGKIPADGLHSLTTGHRLCCFSGSFIKEADGTVVALQKLNSQQTDSCCTPPVTTLVARDRNFVKNNWKLAQKSSCCGGEGAGLDEFLNALRAKRFTLTGMQFQDAMNFDLQRVRHCRVHIYSPKNKLVPFCAYNLTDINGNYLHRIKYHSTDC